MKEVRIVETKEMGKALVSSTSRDMGSEVFREEALIVFDMKPSEGDCFSGPPWTNPDSASLQRWKEYCIFKRQSDKRQKDILGLYAEMACDDAVRMKTFLREKLVGDLLDIEEFVRLAMVIKFNAVGIPPSKYGLFQMACRMAHNCQPNCVWFSCREQEKELKVVRCIDAIREGDILTIDYYGKTFEPIHERQGFFMMSKGFFCQCKRCASTKGDDTRRFPCQKGTCSAVHFCHQPKPGCKPLLLPCSACGHAPSEDYVHAMLQSEKQCRQTMDEIEGDPINTNDFESRITNVELPHENHGIAIRVMSEQVRLFQEQEDWRNAATAQERKLHCFEAIMGAGFKDEDLANNYEKMGDLCAHFDLEKARSAYREAVECHELTRGARHKYTRCAHQKLRKISDQLARF